MNTGKPTMLLADDERTTREALSRYLSRRFQITTAEDGTVALNLIKHNDYDFILTDLRMPGANGMEVLKSAISKKAETVVIVLSAYGTIESAVEALKLGAFDFVEKPINLNRLDIVLKRAAESRELKLENNRLKSQLSGSFDWKEMVSASPAMHEVTEIIKQIAPSRSTVLITGESGSGKEIAAQAIHQLSRRNGPFVAVHCAALPATLLESELFGHERGAFTGAVEQKKGRFELAGSGTLFLDEIGEIDPQVQVKLLRVLETRTFERVGGTEPIHSDARLIAATNRDLYKMVQEGTFREDLFYRLDVVNIKMPPLREREEDIPILVKKFLDHFAAENNRETMTISQEAMEILTQYPWPGNIRELRNCIERMVVLSRENHLDINDVPRNIRDASGGANTMIQVNGDTIDDHEKSLILKTLDECGGNRTLAAKKLGISRRTLYRRLDEYNM